MSESEWEDVAEPLSQYDPEFVEELDQYLEARTAPIRESFERIELERSLAQGEADAVELIASEAARVGVQLDPRAVMAEINGAFVEAAQIMQGQGLAPEEIAARLLTPERAREAVRFVADAVAHEQATRGGDERTVVSRYFGDAGAAASRSRAERPPAEAWQEPIIDAVLRRT